MLKLTANTCLLNKFVVNCNMLKMNINIIFN